MTWKMKPVVIELDKMVAETTELYCLDVLSISSRGHKKLENLR
jgi:hypothetical protein